MKRAAALMSVLALCLATLPLRAGGDDEGVPQYLVWPAYMKHKNLTAPGVMTGIEGESRFETNAFGIRGPDWGSARRKEYRILFLGGSAAECFYLDQDEAWPALIGAQLDRTADGRRVWAGNIGRSGHNSRDHLLEAEILLPNLSVDAIVVMMGVNDLGLRLVQDAAFNPDFLATPENRTYQVGHTFSVHPDDPNLPFYRKGVVGRLLGLDPDAARRKPYLVVDNAGLIFLKWREYRKSGEKVATLPDLAPALAEYRRNTEAIVAAAKKQGVRVLLVTQPALWRAGLTEAEESVLWMGGIGDFQEKAGGRYYTAEALGRGLAAYNAALMETCATTGAECLDVTTKVTQDLHTFYDDCHLNEEGSRKVAEAVAGYLRERPPFRKGE